MANRYKNWSKKPRRAQNKSLSESFPFSIFKWGNGMEIMFTNDNRESIVFYLDEEAKKLFMMNMERFVVGNKDATREQFGLPTSTIKQ